MCIDRFLVAAVLLLAATASAHAGQGRFDGDAARDVGQTMEARKLLADEPDLAAFNIGVTVQNRVATLWGPVPSIEVAFRAELVLRSMFELTAVRNELFVSELVQPMKKPLRIDNAPRYLPGVVPPKLPPLPRSMFGAPGVLMGTENKRPISQPAAKEKPLSVMPRIEANVPMPAPAHIKDGDASLTAAVGNLLAENVAFRQVQFIVKAGRVYLRTSGDTEALHEAARAVARLPNVAGVVLVEQDTSR